MRRPDKALGIGESPFRKLIFSLLSRCNMSFSILEDIRLNQDTFDFWFMLALSKCVYNDQSILIC